MGIHGHLYVFVGQLRQQPSFGYLNRTLNLALSFLAAGWQSARKASLAITTTDSRESAILEQLRLGAVNSQFALFCLVISSPFDLVAFGQTAQMTDLRAYSRSGRLTANSFHLRKPSPTHGRGISKSNLSKGKQRHALSASTGRTDFLATAHHRTMRGGDRMVRWQRAN